MQYKSIIRRAAMWVVLASFLSSGFVIAQAEPTMKEVYATAQAGKLEQAQGMIQQVLISHPKSAKPLFVQSELFARQGKLVQARESFASAEKLAPGLPFAKTESVQALRAQLTAKSTSPVTRNVAPAQYATPATAPSSPSSTSWGLPLLLAGCVIIAGYFMFRRKTSQPFPQQPIYQNQGGMNGPQSFGMAGGNNAGLGGMMPPSYGQQPGYVQPGYAQPAAGSGLGGRIMGGVATGLAVGAGVIAAEAIGRNLMGNHNQSPPPVNNLNNNDSQPIATNTDMGGQDFGLNDTSTWDDGARSDAGGGGDWDN